MSFDFILKKVKGQLIDRANVEFDIVEDFNSEHSVSNAYMITGVRGYGKTVYMIFILSRKRSVRILL